jgi:ABC-type nitrate/sulfonate/bicarbonate transport system permease component
MRALRPSRFVVPVAQLAVTAVLLLAWQLLPEPLGISPFVLPPFSDIVSAASEPLPGGAELMPNVLVTAREIALAFAIAAVAGVSVGIALGSSKRLEALFQPILTALFAVPLIALIPLFLVTLGLGERSKIAFGALYAFFPILFNTTAGVASLEQAHLQVARAFGLSRLDRLRKIVIPGAARQILGGLQIGIAIAIIAVVSAEVFGATAGLGWLIQRSSQSLQAGQVWFVILVTLALAYLFLLLVRLIARALKVRPEGAPW